MYLNASCWWTLSSNFHNLQAFVQAAAAIWSTSSEKGLLYNVFHLIIIKASPATVLTRRSLNWSIPLDFWPLLVILASRGSESVSAAPYFCWELWGPEWNVTGIKACSLELLLCWEPTGPDATIDWGVSTDGLDEEEADQPLVCACGKICSGYFWAVVNKRPVAAFNFTGFEVGVAKCQRGLTSVSSKFVLPIWELVVCEFDIWWILFHIRMPPRPQVISLAVSGIRTWTKGVWFQYTHLCFQKEEFLPLPPYLPFPWAVSSIGW